jgi:transcriptional regulator with PAS, ATPase and Fis domain
MYGLIRSESEQVNNHKINDRDIVDHCYNGMISKCVKMKTIFRLIEKVSVTNSTVLVLGESGTGKELVAQALHLQSGRMGNMVPVNCGAIPEEILESELFGHERGAFTGAVTKKIGRIQMAEGGTLFLDEIGEMSPKLQVKLLRVLQERKVYPVGATRAIDVDVRIVAATNRDLQREINKGNFREDLFYRLSVIPIELPPLRKRDADLKILSHYFLNKACRNFDREIPQISQEVMQILEEYKWPGNIRELENVMERLALLVDDDVVETIHLPEYMQKVGNFNSSNEVLTQYPGNSDIMDPSGVNFRNVIDAIEKDLITRALEFTGWNKKATAELLHLNRTVLLEKIRKNGIKKLDVFGNKNLT